MDVGDLVGFKKELFFEGAVQLGWFQDDPSRAIAAAENFVFHGPRYHGVSEGEDREINNAYKLKDTASFLQELLVSVCPSQQGIDTNPYVLAIAGYGAGKSHFALTAAQLLSRPTSVESTRILKNISVADPEIGDRASRLTEDLKKSVLIIALDGMSNFHLGREFSSRVMRQLKAGNVDLQPVADISPRFQYAQDFVRRNYDIRLGEFETEGLGEVNSVLDELQDKDEDTYRKVDNLYFKVNGRNIPVEGDESLQVLIDTICNVYCGEDGPYSGLIIIFDEFGRYLEYVAEQPTLAGDSALQQIFQGIQDNKGKAHFVGFIQYELNAYLNRFSQRDLRHLKRFTSRFDSAQKLHLSTNLETIFANLIHKKDEGLLSLVLDEGGAREKWKEIHKLFSVSLPGFTEIPVWADFEKFMYVIVRGCWPLHPLATWFLTRQQDVVQSRSALAFIKDAIDAASLTPLKNKEILFSISAASLVLHRMLSEMITAEQIQGRGLVETYSAIVEKFGSRIEDNHRAMLISAVLLDKLRIMSRDKEIHDQFLSYLSGLSEGSLSECHCFLSRELGALEWNNDLGRYELISDAATRSQFVIAMHKKTAKVDHGLIGKIFTNRASEYTDLSSMYPDFNQKNNISSAEWFFRASFAVSDNVDSLLKSVANDWMYASSYTDPKGHIIYVLVRKSDDYDSVISTIKKSYQELFAGEYAAIWTVVLDDRDNKIGENISKLHILQNEFDQSERDVYSRFFAEESTNASFALKDSISSTLRERDYYIAGFDDVPSGRMQIVASKIFQEIYPCAVSFPFDGFSTTSGSGPRDCLLLIEALVKRRVNGDWISLQNKSLQNRATQLLVRDWKVLGSDGALLKSIGNRALRNVLESVEKKHLEDGKRTLGETFDELLKPPYGFNSSSAGIVIGLLLAKENPPRAISHSGESCTFEEWLTKVLPKKKGQYSFDGKALNKSNLLFLEENSYQRWNSNLIDIESGRSYSKLIKFLESASSRMSSDPIPEQLMPRFKLLETKGADAKAKLRRYESDLRGFEDRVSAAEKVLKIERLIELGSDIAEKIKAMREEGAAWEKFQIEELDNLLIEVKELLGSKVGPWIGYQTCNSFQDMDNFKRGLEKKLAELRSIGFITEARQLQEQKHKIVSQLDKRATYELSINRAADLIRLPLPTIYNKAITLTEQKTETTELLNVLKVANKEISANDIENLISGLQGRIDFISDLIDKQSSVIDEILLRPVESMHDIESLLRLVKEQQAVFSATDMENRVDSAYRLLLRFHEDMAHWTSYEVSFDEAEKLLNEQVPKKLMEIKKLQDDILNENLFDIEKIYLTFQNIILESSKRRSSRWLEDFSPDLDCIEKMSLTECERHIEKMRSAPSWVSFSDREKAQSISDLIQKYIDDYVEQERLARAEFWLGSVSKEAEEAGSKGRVYLESLLSKLDKVPEFVEQDSYSEIDAMRKSVQGLLDGLHIDDIFDRICRLREPLRKDLIGKLRELYPTLIV